MTTERELIERRTFVYRTKIGYGDTEQVLYARREEGYTLSEITFESWMTGVGGRMKQGIGSLTRNQAVALKDMLDTALADWPEETR